MLVSEEVLCNNNKTKEIIDQSRQRARAHTGAASHGALDVATLAGQQCLSVCLSTSFFKNVLRQRTEWIISAPCTGASKTTGTQASRLQTMVVCCTVLVKV
jgi:hypothetical protein